MTFFALPPIKEETHRELLREIIITEKITEKKEVAQKQDTQEEKKNTSSEQLMKKEAPYFFENLPIATLHSIFSFLDDDDATSFVVLKKTAQAVFLLSKKTLKKRADYVLSYSQELYPLICKANFFAPQIPISLTETLFAARKLTHLQFERLSLHERLCASTEIIDEEQTQQSCCSRFFNWMCCIPKKKLSRYYVGLQDVARYFPYLQSLNLTAATLDQKSSFYFRYLTHLRSLSLAYTLVKDHDFTHIATLDSLSSLDLSFCDNITSATLQALKTCTQLKTLKAAGCASLKILPGQLKNFSKLSHVDFSGCPNVNNEALKEIGCCKRLHSLFLNHCQSITTLGVKNLAELSLLEHLEIENCPQLDSSVVSVITKQFKHLKTLNLANLTIPDIALKQLTSLQKLSTLNLSDCELTSKDSLLILANSPSLQRLSVGKLWETHHTALEILKNRNKKLRIFIDKENA